MRTDLILNLLLCSVIVSCDIQRIKKEREGEPDVYEVQSSDSDMSYAIEQAKNTLDLFQNALESNNPNYEYFSIKQKFDTPKGGEHIWITTISILDGEFQGVVDNLPITTTEVNIGDTILIDKKRITDWMYFDNEKVKGAYTIRALRMNMSVKERETFDLENGFIFD